MKHPAVMKAVRIGRIAKENDWHGSIEKDGVTTVLVATRNDERIECRWTDQQLTEATYSLFEKTWVLPCSKAVLEHVTGWPDIIKLLKNFPDLSKVELVKKYRRLPFDWQTASDEEIIANLVGRQIIWYSHISQKMNHDLVIVPRTKRNHPYIKQVGHRKMFNYIGSHSGFASVLLDTLIKVG